MPRDVIKNAEANELAAKLRKETRGEILFSPADRGRYATDASIYQQMPVGVLVPRTFDDVASAIQIANDLDVSILPRGGGTSQCGQTTGTGLVVDCSKYLRRSFELDVEGRTVRVEPGMVLDHLNAELKPHGLWFPVDVSTAAQATLGGMAGNNSCGSRSIAYGNMVHNVLGAEVFFADGSVGDFERFEHARGRVKQMGDFVSSLALAHKAEIEAQWPKVMRRVAGYNLDVFHNQSEKPYTADDHVNLSHLLIGSEGTLAFTKSLKLQLAPMPKAKVLGVVNFKTFHRAMESAQHIVKLKPTAVELVDRTMIDLSLANPAFAPTIRTALIGAPEAILLVEFCGESKTEITRKLNELDELIASLGSPNAVVKMIEDTPQKNLWEVRKAGLNIMMSLKGDGKPVSFIEDCAVPLQHLAEYTAALTEVFARHGTRGTWYAHASVGTLHVRPILDMRRDGAQKMRAIAEEAAALVRRFKGAYSGEHGDGLCRGEWIAWQFGPKINEAFRSIKQKFDPNNRFNPGKIIDPPRMDEVTLFRLPPTYKVIPIKPALDWQAWDVQNDPVTEKTSEPGSGGDAAQGLAKAAEMCNNNGHCRKFDAGTMCPSYRVTRDESASTRGRANTLRLALAGQIEGGLGGDAVHAALNLCVSCKGCKRDCPTGVDMAKMKIEHLAARRQTHGLSLKDKMVAYLPKTAPWISYVAPFANALMQSPRVKSWLGIAQSRTLPAFRRDNAWREKNAHHVSTEQILAYQKQGKTCAVLFVDTFNAAYEIENVHAALRVLHAMDVMVHVVNRGEQRVCCGRTYLAVGMVNEAKREMARLLEMLSPFANAGIPILGLEPSCTFTLHDEAQTMGLGVAAKTVAQHTMLIDSFIAQHIEILRPRLKAASQPIVVHGHCHQKAFDVVTPTIKTLAAIPSSTVSLIESSCCGMAGSFGYDAEHLETSLAMAELALLPAVRRAEHAIVVADGTSCRHQIADGAAREARHLVQVLAQHLSS
jgi:FAD/FMN-containing dehydrogenase/Fe-S oxidoreductase